MAGRIGDVRLVSSAAFAVEAMAVCGSSVIRRFAPDRADTVRMDRLLGSGRIDHQGLLTLAGLATAKAAAGLDIVCAQDTTEVSFRSPKASAKGLGPAGNGRRPGLFIHPVVAMDASSGALLGLCDGTIWTRTGKLAAARGKRALADKQTHVWAQGIAQAGHVLASARRVTVVSDRESDVYGVLVTPRAAHVDLVIRARHDRSLDGGETLFEALAGEPAEAVIPVQVAPKGPGDKGRIARVELRARRVTLMRPKIPANRGLPDRLEVTIVEAREIDAPPPTSHARPALLWRLIATAERPAAEIVACYRLRWRIEEVFRALKSEGLDFEATQVREPERLFRLAVLALSASLRHLQLVDARNGSSRPTTDVLDEDLIPVVKAISDSLETPKSRVRNPYPPENLAFVAFTCARLGGWFGYGKPPGAKTMRIGWERLIQRINGFLIAKNPLKTKSVNP